MTFKSDLEHMVHSKLMAAVRAVMDETLAAAPQKMELLRLISSSYTVHESLLVPDSMSSIGAVPMRVTFDFGPVLASEGEVYAFSQKEFLSRGNE
jgi:aspartate aminotransferase-like enzyme